VGSLLDHLPAGRVLPTHLRHHDQGGDGCGGRGEYPRQPLHRRFLGGRAQRACENLANALDCKLPEARAVRLRLNGISDQQITRAATIICAFGLQAHQVSLFVRLGEDGVILELVDQVSAQRFDIYPAKK
jgi:hypothetical protein